MNINLEQKKIEYIKLGLQTGLFNEKDIQNIYKKLSDIKEIVINNNLKGDAFTNPKNKTIEINTDRCAKQGEWFQDEVLFHEFSHYANELHRDLYIENHKFEKFCDENKKYSYDDVLKQIPIWGVILLDEVVAQKIAQMMVEEKYNIKYKNNYYYGKLSNPPRIINNDFNDYPDYVEFAEKFAKTLFQDGTLEDLATLCLKTESIDFILNKYQNKKDGVEELYNILSYMGNIVMKDYASKGQYQIKGSGKNITDENIYKSMLCLDEILSNNKCFKF